jgi:hypothetical protein
MRSMPPREWPRRGACWGSRLAKAGAAACLALVLVALVLPGSAAAYRCGATQLDGAQETARSSQDCRAERSPAMRNRTPKRGSMKGLTVFVLAVAAVLLIPIGARGIPPSVDPYSDDRPRRF